MAYFRKTYIQLGQNIPTYERQNLERSISAALKPAMPNATFVSELEHELIAEAERHYKNQVNAMQGLRVVGLIGGGLLSIVGGVLMVLLWQQRKTENPEQTKSINSLFKTTKLAEV
jgi:hypothetical protein